ncbi:hypothetical protein HZA86_04740 [Candidatus Uhrbacteria bacterium]|nr:hypothetical protein [Candidatus Uhrbacteria bacterium]
MNLIFGGTFLLVSIITRLIPHAPNVAPIAALALWAGVYLPKRWGWALPIGAMLASDLFVGFYDLRLMATVYGSFIVTVGIGRVLRRWKDPSILLAGSLVASTFFFLVTNFAVWLLSSWYPHTPAGLMLSYTLGLPFFRNTLLGDLLYTGAFFGAYQGFGYLIRSKRAVATPAPL